MFTTPHLSRRAVIGGAAGAGAVALVGGGFAAAPALAAVKQPRVYTTAEWGARRPDQNIEVVNQRPTKIIVHHTASPNSTDYSKAHAFAVARNIQNLHMAKDAIHDWGDSGQHFTISRGGYVMEARHGSLKHVQGRKSFIKGIHARSANAYSIGIENEGLYTDVLPPKAQYDALVNLLAWLCWSYGLKADAIDGHRDHVATECPGKLFYSKLSQLRADVAKKLGTTAPPPKPPTNPTEPVTWAVLASGSRGDKVYALQHLLRSRGQRVDADGSFGPGTRAGVVAFQRSAGLSADGIVGAKTWAKLIQVVRPGARGDLALGVQRALVANGVRVATDGSFGPLTQKGVRSFQKENHLEEDGIVGPKTWNELLSR
ncbi:peptidoglycan recognition protein family protein [Mariniluteicoccus flavus]